MPRSRNLPGSNGPPSPRLQAVATDRLPAIAGYQSEINLRAEAWVRQMGEWLTRGAALLIDYGFPRHEYYHPQRDEGTLMCHSPPLHPCSAACFARIARHHRTR